MPGKLCTYREAPTLTQTYELKLTTRADGSLTLPARGYSWPSFEDGNTAALVHGVYSERSIEARTADVRWAHTRGRAVKEETRDRGLGLVQSSSQSMPIAIDLGKTAHDG